MASTSIEVKYEDGTDDRYFILTHPVLFIDPIILDDMKRKKDVDCFMVMRKIFDVARVYPAATSL